MLKHQITLRKHSVRKLKYVTKCRVKTKRSRKTNVTGNDEKFIIRITLIITIKTKPR